MKKWIVSLILALLILGGVAVAVVPWSSFSEPPVPHSIEQRSDCTGCHALDGVKPYPSWHAKRAFDNDACLGCHKVALEAK